MKTPKPILDRRRSIRVSEQLPFKIGHENYEIEVKTINVSEHGALCLVDKNVPLMTQLAVAIALPPENKKSKKGKIVRMKAVVVRREKDVASDRYFLALFFSSISPEDKETFNKFLQSRLAHAD